MHDGRRYLNRKADWLARAGAAASAAAEARNPRRFREGVSIDHPLDWSEQGFTIIFSRRL
jgi:hypothetical protein